MEEIIELVKASEIDTTKAAEVRQEAEHWAVILRGPGSVIVDIGPQDPSILHLDFLKLKVSKNNFYSKKKGLLYLFLFYDIISVPKDCDGSK